MRVIGSWRRIWERKRKLPKCLACWCWGGAMLAKAEEAPKTPENAPGPHGETDGKSTGVAPTPPATTKVPQRPAQKQIVPQDPSGPSSGTNTPKEHKTREFCQVELTLNKYDRSGVTPIKTCLDGKSSEEILKLVEKAKKQTCQSPFCGCWLG